MAEHCSMLKSQVEVAHQLQNFATKIFQDVGKSTEGNMCISPFSIATLLSMVHAGAKGDTANQLKEALGLGKFSEEEIHATLGNMIKSTEGGDNHFFLKYVFCFKNFVEEKFKMKENFQSIMEKNFGAQTELVNYGDPKICKMNSYVDTYVEELYQKNDDLSENAIGHDGDDTWMILFNVLYFKGNWFEQFDPNLTENSPFFLGSKTSKVDGQKLSMVIILPNKVDGLAKVERKISRKVLDEMEKHAKQKKLCVKLPKFNIETMDRNRELLNALFGMGIKDLFVDGLADLSGLSDSPGLFVPGIVQKCCFQVDENGMVAAAATAPPRNIMALCFPSKVPSFAVDHPAVFLVKDDKTKLVLFVGRLANPAQE